MNIKERLLDGYVALVRWVMLRPDRQLMWLARIGGWIGRPLTWHTNYKKKVEEVLARVAAGNPATIALAHRVAREGNPKLFRAFAVNFILGRLVFGIRKTVDDRHRERRLARRGIYLPSIVALSVTSRCNIKCLHCWGERFDPDVDLPLEDVDRTISEGLAGGILIYVMTGGEPTLRDDLWEIYRKHSRATFLILTNGTLIDEAFANTVAEIGRFVFNISLDGFKKTNDARRGEGVFDKVVNAMRLLRERGMAYGISVTVTAANFYEVVSDDFMRFATEQGAYGVFFNKYIPADREPRLEWELSSGQEKVLRAEVECFRDQYPMLVRIGEVASPDVQTCDAARRHVHVAPNGDIEPCLFCPVSGGNIRESSLEEVMNGKFFRKIRSRNAHGLKGKELLKPCMMFRDPAIREELVAMRGGSDVTK